MVTVDFAPVEDLQTKGDWTGLGRMMVRAAKTLAGAGAEAIVICANTMHQLAPDIKTAGRPPLIHIADATAAAAVDFALSRPI